MDKTLLSVKETAERLGVSIGHIHHLIAGGDLTVVDIRKPGSQRPRYIVPMKVIDQWIESRTINRQPNKETT